MGIVMTFCTVLRRWLANGASPEASVHHTPYTPGVAMRAHSVNGASKHMPVSLSTDQCAARCVALIAEIMARLPLRCVAHNADSASEYCSAALRLLQEKPNAWQTPQAFRRQMQIMQMRYGHSYARVIWSLGEPVALIPLNSQCVHVEEGEDKQPLYHFTNSWRGTLVLPAHEVFHLHDASTPPEIQHLRMMLTQHVLDLSQPVKSHSAHGLPVQNIAESRVASLMAVEKLAQTYVRKKSLFAARAAEHNGLKVQLQTSVEEIAALFDVPIALLTESFAYTDLTSASNNQPFLQGKMCSYMDSWESAVRGSLLSTKQRAMCQVRFGDPDAAFSTLDERNTLMESVFTAKHLVHVDRMVSVSDLETQDACHSEDCVR